MSILSQHMQYKSVQYRHTHRGKVAPLLSQSGGLTQGCLCLFHTTVLYQLEQQCLYLFESDGTMLHLNLLLLHRGVVASMKLSSSLHGFTYKTLNSNFSAKSNKKKWLIWIGSAMQYWNSSYEMFEVRIPRENSIFFFVLFVCFVGDEAVHIYISASAFSHGVVHIHTNQLMPWHKKREKKIMEP